jgi:hypothetical protein
MPMNERALIIVGTDHITGGVLVGAGGPDTAALRTGAAAYPPTTRSLCKPGYYQYSRSRFRVQCCSGYPVRVVGAAAA